MTLPAVSRITVDAPHGSSFVPTPTPVLGWWTSTPTPGWQQAAAEIEAIRAGVSETRVIDGDRSVDVAWPFEPLTPKEDLNLRVRVRGAEEEFGPWSEPRILRAGFLSDGAWTAATIAADAPSAEAQPVLLRREFTLDGPAGSALLYAAAVGVYQVSINGVDIDDHVLKPGWTAYQARTVHDTTDVAGLLREGVNTITVRLGGGWATELYGFSGNWHTIYAAQPTFAAQLHVSVDGVETVVATDADWQWAEGPVVDASIYHGETYDQRRQPGGPEAWRPVRVAEPMPVPEARVSPFVRRTEEIGVAEVITTPSGKLVLDFGQNLVGRLRLTVDGPAGATITLRHAEVLEHGELGIRPLREARATDRLTLAGTGPFTWEPEFTFHGFRYAQIDGWPGTFDPAAVTAQVIHSDMERTGWFETSHELIQKLHDNVVWGLRGNFLSIPTDCPQRDERLGWTGDIQVFAPTASFLYDVNGFLTSWLRDLVIEQVDGVAPFVVPNVLGDARPAAAWGDAATVVPRVLHERHGEEGVLRRQFDSMKAWVDAIDRRSPGHLWEGAFQFGDWLDPDAPPENAAKAKADPGLVATAHLFLSARIVGETAALLGRPVDAARYTSLAEATRIVFLDTFVTGAGRMLSDAPTAYALAIVFGIAPDDLRPTLGRRLAHLVAANSYRISTGFVGTPIITDALTQTGQVETARRLLLSTQNPSWLYPVTMGATTIWERWDSMLPDGTINPGEMTSFNHYALGAVADWLHRRVAGLAPAAPGYAELEIAPILLEGLGSAHARHLTPYGPAAAGWRRDGDEVTVTALVPPNTQAHVLLPDGTRHEVGSGEHSWKTAWVASAPAPTALSVQSTLDKVIVDEEAHGLLTSTVGEDADERIRVMTGWGAGTTVRDMVESFHLGARLPELVEGFRELNRSRGLA